VAKEKKGDDEHERMTKGAPLERRIDKASTQKKDATNGKHLGSKTTVLANERGGGKQGDAGGQGEADNQPP